MSPAAKMPGTLVSSRSLQRIPFLLGTNRRIGDDVGVHREPKAHAVAVGLDLEATLRANLGYHAVRTHEFLEFLAVVQMHAFIASSFVDEFARKLVEQAMQHVRTAHDPMRLELARGERLG